MENEMQCSACSGSGQISTPKMDFDYKGEPIVITEVLTCHACNGNGKVRV